MEVKIMTNLETRQEQQDRINALLGAIRGNGGSTTVSREGETIAITVIGGRYGEDTVFKFSPLLQGSILQTMEALQAYIGRMEMAISKEGTISSWERALR